jgi:hypothetical protein
MISYKYVFSFFLAILLVMISIAQSGRASESLELLSDSLIKREISSFSTTKTTSRNSSIPLKNQMIEIPLQHCSDSEVHFSLSKFNSSISTFIHLYFKQPPAGRIIDSIFVVTHSHFWVKIPQSAYEGIYQNLSCDVSGGRGKKERVVSPNYKAYYSANKRRMYIYMIGGSEGNKYEVTWVFVDDKYFTRVLDMLQ